MTEQQRRQFSRIRFHGDAALVVADRRVPCEVRDLSLKGARVVTTEALGAASGDPCVLELRLNESDAVVRMEGTIAHGEDLRIGLACRSIDLDSITHLRRLLELNLGDAQLLEREFSALIAG